MSPLINFIVICGQVSVFNPEYSLEGQMLAKAEVPILWPPDVKSWVLRKHPDSGKDWRQKEKRVAEDEMVRHHPRLNGCECDESLGDGEGQGRLECCSPWGCRVRHDFATEQQRQSEDSTTQMYRVQGVSFPLTESIIFSSTHSCDCQKPLFLFN